MKLGCFEYYLIAVNILGFVLFMLNTWLYRHTESMQIDTVLTVICLLGASPGMLLSMLLFDRRVVKENMMSRVFIACVFVIQLILFLVWKGHVADQFRLDFWNFFDQHKVLVIYLVIINLITLIAFAIDKIAAIESKSRIRIVTLLGMAFIGGSVGALAGMYFLRHKTKKDYFTVGVPLIIVMQIVILLYAMNAAW